MLYEHVVINYIQLSKVGLLNIYATKRFRKTVRLIYIYLDVRSNHNFYS